MVNNEAPLPPRVMDKELVVPVDGDNVDYGEDVIGDVELEMNNQFDYIRITGYEFLSGILMFKVLYLTVDGDITLSIPFSTLKLDKPQEVAKHIRDYVVEPRRDG